MLVANRKPPAHLVRGKLQHLLKPQLVIVLQIFPSVAQHAFDRHEPVCPTVESINRSLVCRPMKDIRIEQVSLYKTCCNPTLTINEKGVMIRSAFMTNEPRSPMRDRATNIPCMHGAWNAIAPAFGHTKTSDMTFDILLKFVQIGTAVRQASWLCNVTQEGCLATLNCMKST